ncbi:MAG TPA: hypothetical protein VEK77_06795 [Gemmatimonadales bacterium]|nr:hypothetical protein [Gemmatimonadales bacterium]
MLRVARLALCLSEFAVTSVDLAAQREPQGGAAWLAVGVGKLWRFGDGVVFRADTATKRPDRDALVAFGDKASYTAEFGIPVGGKGFAIVIRGESIGKRTLVDSTGQQVGTISAFDVSVGGAFGYFYEAYPVYPVLNIYLGAAHAQYKPTSTVQFPHDDKTDFYEVGELGLGIKIIPPVRAEITGALGASGVGIAYWAAYLRGVVRIPIWGS